MNLAPMRYKDYVWPHNPRVYEITFDRSFAVNKIPFGRYIMTNLGRTFRILRGEGEFAGEGAYDEFKKLATVYCDDSPGILVHPVWMSTSVYFSSLVLRQELREDYVSYTFEFWEKSEEYTEEPSLIKPAAQEKPEAGGGGQRKEYTVVSGDTLWAVAKRNGIGLTELISLNPQIKNPNRIYPGDKIYLS